MQEEISNKLDIMKENPLYRKLFLQRVEMGERFREKFENLANFLAFTL